MTAHQAAEGIRLAVCTGRRCGRRGRRLAKTARRAGNCAVIETDCLARCLESPVVVAYPAGMWCSHMTSLQLRDFLAQKSEAARSGNLPDKTAKGFTLPDE